MADQNNGNENGAPVDNADNLNAAEQNQAGDDIWDQIFDQNFVANQNAYDYEAHHAVLLQNLLAGHNNMFLHHNGFPMPQQVVVQPEAVAHSSSSQPSGFNDVQSASDSFPNVQSSMASGENDNPDAPSVLPSMEGWGYVNEAYQTDSCSSLSEFVASTESQQEVSIETTKEESPVEGNFLEVPETLVTRINMQAFMRRFDDSSEKNPPNPPNTPVSGRSDLNLSSSAFDCSPKLPTSPGLCLRSAIKALSNISQKNKEASDFHSSEGQTGDLTKSKNVVKSASSAAKVNVERAIGRAAKVQVKRKSRDDHNEENIQITLSRPTERPDYLFVKFGSFMVILVLFFPLAIIACLQGLLPEKYINAFLVFLILSLFGACYFFIKACYVKNNETSDTNEISAVRYGSIQSPKPGTSAESA